MTINKAKQILDRYISGTATAEEEAWIENAYQEYAKTIINSENFNIEKVNDKVNVDQVGELLIQYIQSKQLVNWPFVSYLTKIAAAILIVTVAGWGGFYYFRSDQKNTYTVASNGYQATLSFEGEEGEQLGEVWDLNDSQSGIVMDKQGITYADGSAFDLQQPKLAQQLKLSTPEGGTYQVILSDGSRVWLNAASSLKYPTQFSEDERVVHLDGEAYFEVVSQKRPFKVFTTKQEIQVLGTKFNISAYQDDGDLKTTLLEGKVQVVPRDFSLQHNIILKPGEQSVLKDQNLEVLQVEIDNYTAWVKGDIIFDEANLQEMFRQLERWYVIRFDFEDGLPQGKLYGKISRKAELSAVLSILNRNTDRKFTIINTANGERRVRVHK